MTNGDLKPADVALRIAAVLVDSIIIWIVTAILLVPTIGLSMMRGRFTWMFGIPFFVGAVILPFLYFTFFEAYMNGQTPGKMLCTIRTVKANGEPITLVESLIRNILRIIDWLPTLYLLGFILTLVSEKRQRIGDMAANTIVIKIK